MSEKFDVTIIGGGPAGYVCAIRASQLGLKTACIESRGTLGGTCLNIGCIPSKSLLNLSEAYHKAQDIKLNLAKMMKNKDNAVTILTRGVDFLLKKNKVTHIKGIGSLIGNNKISINSKNNETNIIESKNIVVSTGSEAATLPGLEFDEVKILSSTGALNMSKVPKKMIIIGAG